MKGQTLCILIAISCGKIFAKNMPDIYLNLIGGSLFIIMGIYGLL